MSRKCRSEGCTAEILYKTLEGAYVDPTERRPGGIRSPPDRGSPNPYHRYSTGSAPVLSQYCRQHTCCHFMKEEGCTNKKPRHDSVCAIHAQCPIKNCTQARGQYCDTQFDHISGALPRYSRYDLCFDHKCTVRQCQKLRSPRSIFCQAHGCHVEGCKNMSQEKANCCEEHQCQEDGCRTIVDGDYPYCAMHIQCKIKPCGMTRHFLPKTKEYLAFCTDHATCEVNRCRDTKLERSPFCAIHTCHERDCSRNSQGNPYCPEHGCTEIRCENPKLRSSESLIKYKFCALHTCRGEECQEFVDRLAVFCKAHGCSKEKCHQEAMAEQFCLDHLKAEYMAQGERIARGRDTGRTYPPPTRDYYTAAQRGRGRTARTGSVTDTVTEVDETDSEDDRGDITNGIRGLFAGSNLSNDSKTSNGNGANGNGTNVNGSGNGTEKNTANNSQKRQEKRGRAPTVPPAPFGNDSKVSNNSNSRKKKKQQSPGNWDVSHSPRSMGSADSLMAEQGFSGFDTDNAGGAAPSAAGIDNIATTSNISGGAGVRTKNGKREM
ncbi:hypothetical protein B0H67DRAFT_360170 [Lasiosphaeris hirsuta]|uniref:Uncharacterized protein n=1 Tax=Lasiosphaeris hirsuta TaxID=260670 RepID=A0AA39ZWF3_9PEZI|nr:hypothetical protein B0H67DRAFT_360170 [Lasiosphaeris hirsuta]